MSTSLLPVYYSPPSFSSIYLHAVTADVLLVSVLFSGGSLYLLSTILFLAIILLCCKVYMVCSVINNMYICITQTYLHIQHTLFM